jgi:putative ABC transport system substrate-binding protein
MRVTSPTRLSNRRAFIAALGALAYWRAGQAQARVPVLGLLWIETKRPSPHLAPLLQGLREQGYVRDRDIRIDDRFFAADFEQLGEAARNLVAQRPDVVLTYGGSAVQALQRTSTTIPVVIAGSGDPVKLGVVKSLARPGTNFTGLTILAADLSGKRLELLMDAFPMIRRIAVPYSPQSTSEAASVANLEVAARQKDVQVHKVEVRSATDIGAAFGGLRKAGIDAIVFVPGTLFRAHAGEVASEVARTRMPAIYGDEQYVEAGGLLGYGPAIADNFRRSAAYIDKILKGAKPADLPIEQPTRIYLSINLKTAKAQGIDIPRELLRRADRIIE